MSIREIILSVVASLVVVVLMLSAISFKQRPERPYRNDWVHTV